MFVTPIVTHFFSLYKYLHMKKWNTGVKPSICKKKGAPEIYSLGRNLLYYFGFLVCKLKFTQWLWAGST